MLKSTTQCKIIYLYLIIFVGLLFIINNQQLMAMNNDNNNNEAGTSNSPSIEEMIVNIKK
ncbi:MAG: hypothetical protein WJU30_00093 [Candidatus Phytoplasma pruni]